MRKVAVILVLTLLSVAAHADGVWTHGYDFTTGSTNDLAGSGATLATLGGTLSSGGYSFATGQGVNLTNAVSGDYSVHFVFTYNGPSWNNWEQILAFSTTTQAGLWIAGGGLQGYSYTGVIPNATIAPNTKTDIILTHDGSYSQIYLNGQLVSTTTAVMSNSGATLYFFPNFWYGQATGGTLSKIDTYSGVLTQAQVKIVDDDGISSGKNLPVLTPEPASMLLFGTGLALIAPFVRRFHW